MPGAGRRAESYLNPKKVATQRSSPLPFSSFTIRKQYRMPRPRGSAEEREAARIALNEKKGKQRREATAVSKLQKSSRSPS